MSRLALPLLTAAVALLAACETEPPGPEPDTGPVIVEVYPEPGATDVFGGDVMMARFDRAPDEAAISLLDPNGDSVAGVASESDDGLTVWFDPTDDLLPSSDYLMSVTREPSDPVDVEFTTSRHGEPLGEDADSLRSTVFALDLSEARFVEPPAGGSLFVTRLEKARVLIGFDDRSAFGIEDQPAVHLIAALSSDDGTQQDPCSRTAMLTFGLDAEHGTDDDAPGSWEDPRLVIGPRDLQFVIGLLFWDVTEFEFRATFHPERTGWKGGVLAGTMDLRDIDPIVDPTAEPGLVCDILGAGGIDGFECPDGSGPVLPVVAGRGGQRRRGRHAPPGAPHLRRRPRPPRGHRRVHRRAPQLGRRRGRRLRRLRRVAPFHTVARIRPQEP